MTLVQGVSGSAPQAASETLTEAEAARFITRQMRKVLRNAAAEEA